MQAIILVIILIMMIMALLWDVDIGGNAGDNNDYDIDNDDHGIVV